MKKINVLSACKLMPYYRIGVFSELSKNNSKLKFYFYGDTKSQGGIKQIPFEHSDEKHPFFIRWVRTKNYFHKPERLLWQTGIIEEIFNKKQLIGIKYYEEILERIPRKEITKHEVYLKKTLASSILTSLLTAGATRTD